MQVAPSRSWTSCHPGNAPESTATFATARRAISGPVSNVGWPNRQSLPPESAGFVVGAVLAWQRRARSKRCIGQGTQGGSGASIKSRWRRYWDEHKRLLQGAREKRGGPSPKGAAGKAEVPWKRLIQEFKAEARARYLIPATVLSVVLTLITATRAHLTGRMLDLAVKRPSVPIDLLKGLFITYMVIAVSDYFLDVVRSVLFACARWDMSISMRRKVFANILVQDQDFFQSRKAGELTSRLNNDVDQMQETLNRAPEKLVVETVRLATSLTIMLRTNVFLTAWSILPLPVVVFFIKQIATVVSLYGVAQNDAMAKANRVSDEALRNSRTVQAHVAVQEERREYQRATEDYLQVIRHTLFSETVLRFMRRLFFDAGTDVPLFCLCVFFIWKSELTVGSFYTYRFVLFSYRRAFNELVEQYIGLRRVQAVSQRYFDLLDRKPKITDPADGDGYEPTQEELQAGLSLEFDNVTFSYDGVDEHAVKNLSFKVPAGESVAVVGRSGAGKSTLVKLCFRFYDPQQGSILLGGVDLRKWKLSALRRVLGVVDQDPVLFDRSIRQNISYGLNMGAGGEDAPQVPFDDVQAASKAAAADDFIVDMPDGYDSLCGERGGRLSGGQRQRVTLARALLRQPRLLILDEHSSSLDTVTEAAVTTALEKLRNDSKQSMVVIAHRLSTVRSAARILVMETGQLVEQGSHDELMDRKDSKYKALVSAQVVKSK